MNTTSRQGWIVLLGLSLAFSTRPAQADKPVPAADLAVDQLVIKGGPKLLGAVLGREADGQLAFAVRREWLRQTHPKFFDTALGAEAAETRAALRELRDRIADWRKARPNADELESFLQPELERIDKELQSIQAEKRVEDAPFMVIDFPAPKFERVVSLPMQRRAVARTAWREQLADVESRSFASLAQELKKKQVATSDDPDELLEFFPPRRENTAAWAARQAIVEYHLRKPLDFQGTGDLVFQTGDKMQAAQGAKLIEGLLKSLAGGSLQDLLDPTAANPQRAPGQGAAEKWLATASQAATAADVNGFRGTRVAQDIEARRVEVETRFVARLPDGSWRTVWQHVEKTDASKPRPEIEQQILQDPQVGKALDLVRSIGLGAEDQIKLAIRFGAATLESQKAADSRFFQFRDRYIRRLDGPVLRVAPLAVPPGRAK